MIPQHPGLLQFCKLVVSLARDLLKVELPPFHFWLRAVHKELIALKDDVLLHEKIQEETRNDDRIEQQRRKKDTLHLTEFRKKCFQIIRAGLTVNGMGLKVQS